MLYALLLFLLLNGYALTSGFRDALAFSRLGADAVKFNVHIPFVLERVIVFAVAAVSLKLTLVPLLIVGLAWGQTFSLLRDFTYYTWRHNMDPGQPAFDLWYGSSTSTAKVELTPRLRLLLFITGVATIAALMAV